MSCRFAFVLALVGLFLASCASLPRPIPVTARDQPVTSPVPGSRTGSLAIWSGRPAATGIANEGFVASASDSGGLVLHDFRGAALQSVAGERLSDLDLTSLPLQDGFTVLLGGTRRSSGRTRLAFSRLDSGTGQTARAWGEIATDLAEPRGFCMRQTTAGVQAVAFDRHGAARQFTISEGPEGEVRAQEIRRFQILDGGRGCAIAAVDGHIYISHARRGFWRYPLAAGSNAPPTHVGGEGPDVIPRAESVAIFSSGRDIFLASLDQDHLAFSLWRVGRSDVTWINRIEVRGASDGLAVRSLSAVDAYGDTPGGNDGLMVVRGKAGGGAAGLHFVDWSAIERALGL